MKKIYNLQKRFTFPSSGVVKAGAFLAALLFSFSLAFSQAPANDLCSNAISLPLGTVLQGTTVGATLDNATFCQAQNTGPGVWYVVQGTGAPITISTCDYVNFDTKIGIYSGSCASLYCVAGNDDSPSCAFFASEVTFASQQGENYYVLVHGFGPTSGAFNVKATSSQAVAANSSCANATPITCGSVTSGTTAGGSIASVPTCDGVTVTSQGVWYSFVATGGPMVIETCSPNTTFDTRLSVYDGSCGALVCRGANDDFCGLQSKVELSSTVQGVTMYVLVHGFGTDIGDFDLTLSCPVPPPNDQPCNATPLVMGPNPFNNTNAMVDSGEVTPGAGSDPNSCRQENGWCFFEPFVQNSVWFTITVPPSGCVNVLVEGFDVQAALWQATNCNDYSTYTEIWANDDSGNLLNPSLPASGPAALVEVACLTPGATYLLQVDGFNGSEGQGTITLTDCGNDPLTLNAPSCLTTFTGPGIPEDTTFMLASASGGFPPYTWIWPQAGNEPSILYPNEIQNGIAVKPDSTKTYTVILEDSKGCTQTADITVFVENLACITAAGDTNVNVCFAPDPTQYPVIVDFDTDPFGNTIPWGTIMRDQYAAYGLTISAQNNRNNHPDEAILFPSNTPTGRDFDLGTPNELFGGPGRGNGGQLAGSLNNVALNNILILAEDIRDNNNDGLVDDPDDEAAGGVITFDFDNPVTLHRIKLVDLDDGPGGSVMVCHSGNGTTSFPVPTIGDNSVIDYNINISGVDQFQVTYVGSGGIAEIEFTPDTTSLCLDPNEVNIDSLLNTNEYSLGVCTNFCDDEAVSWDPPAPCEDLTLTITPDIFADTENSWTLVDLTTGQVVDSRELGLVIGLATETNTYCVNPTHCYEFTLFDQGGFNMAGDGWPFFFGGGSYSIDFIGQTIVSVFDDPFGNPLPVETQQVGACGNRLASQSQTLEHNAFPNPFQDETTISFSVPEEMKVRVEVFNLAGQLVGLPYNDDAMANFKYEVDFKAGQNRSGIYFYRITTSNGDVETGRLVLTK